MSSHLHSSWSEIHDMKPGNSLQNSLSVATGAHVASLLSDVQLSTEFKLTLRLCVQHSVEADRAGYQLLSSCYDNTSVQFVIADKAKQRICVMNL